MTTMDVPREKSKREIRLKILKRGSPCWETSMQVNVLLQRKKKMLGNHLECLRTYLGTVGIDKNR